MTKKEIKNILLKSVVIGFGILVYSSIMTIFFADFAYAIHQMMFDISGSETKGLEPSTSGVTGQRSKPTELRLRR